MSFPSAATMTTKENFRMTQRYIFDLETDSLFDENLTTVHSLVLKDIDSGNILSYANDPDYLIQGMGIEQGVETLAKADLMVGYNSTRFDLPVLHKLYPLEFSLVLDACKGKHLDLLLCSRLIWTDLLVRDIRQGMPKDCQGRHSLKSWGYRLGLLKGDFLDNNSYEEWSQDMQTYCERDVDITFKLYELYKSKNYSEDAVKLEHKFAEIIFQQEENGFGFDIEGGAKLYGDLVNRRDKIRNYLVNEVPAKLVEMKRPEFYTTKDGNKFLTISEAKRAGYDREDLVSGPPKNQVRTLQPNQ